MQALDLQLARVIPGNSRGAGHGHGYPPITAMPMRLYELDKKGNVKRDKNTAHQGQTSHTLTPCPSF